MKYRIHFTDEQINYILSDYKNGSKSINKLKKEFNVEWGTIARVIRDGGLEIHGIRESRLKYSVDESYFEIIDTENKAYWLGFIAADGCVRTDEKTFTLSLAEKDRCHLEKFLHDLTSDYLIYEHVKKVGDNEYPGVRVQITNPVFCRALIGHGITPRKTATLVFPNIPQEFERHFVRGLFDGDGCVSGDNTCPTFSICGTQMVLERVKEIISPESSVKLYARNYGMDTFRTLSFGGRVQLEKIYHLLYDDSTIWMDRKKKIFEEITVKPESKPYFSKSLEKMKHKCVCVTTGEVFDSMTEASLKYSIPLNNISRCCRHVGGRAGFLNGFPMMWEFAENYDPDKKYVYKKPIRSSIPVYCITTKEKFESITSANKRHPSAPLAGISSNCKDEQYYSGRNEDTGEALIWMYYEKYLSSSESEVKSKLDKGKLIASREHQIVSIECVNTGEIFKSIKSASDKYAVDASDICNCCKGNKESAGVDKNTGDKLYWKYA